MVRAQRRQKTNPEKIEKKVLGIILLFGILFLCLCSAALKERSEKKEREVDVEYHQKSLRKRKKREKEKIRIVLTNSSMASIFHDYIEITGSGAYSVSEKDGLKKYAPGKVVKFFPKDFEKGKNEINISCEKGKIRVNSILRRGKNPSYRGRIIIKKQPEGLVLINEVSMKEYLYGVLPGEMSPDFPMEALKAQAVCARSYAWNQMKSKKYKKYGAHVDDTTAFQVYNMAGEDSRTKKAVDCTEGELLCYKGKVVTAYFYSTSWGYSATPEEVWGGGATSLYPCELQITEKSRKETRLNSLDLKDEKVFKGFISKDLCHVYDEKTPWYRWKVKISGEELGKKLGLGEIRKIRVLERGYSGVLQKICVEGKNGSEVITGQQSIRESLMLYSAKVETKDGNLQSLSMLPSAAFFVKDSILNGKIQFYLLGGGFGHGVGMSQNGASAMATDGYSYKEILSHYYGKCEIS